MFFFGSVIEFGANNPKKRIGKEGIKLKPLDYNPEKTQTLEINIFSIKKNPKTSKEERKMKTKKKTKRHKFCCPLSPLQTTPQS